MVEELRFAPNDQVLIKRDIAGAANHYIKPDDESGVRVGRVIYHTGQEYIVGYLGSEWACSEKEIDLVPGASY